MFKVNQLEKNNKQKKVFYFQILKNDESLILIVFFSHVSIVYFVIFICIFKTFMFRFVKMLLERAGVVLGWIKHPIAFIQLISHDMTRAEDRQSCGQQTHTKLILIEVSLTFKRGILKNDDSTLSRIVSKKKKKNPRTFMLYLSLIVETPLFTIITIDLTKKNYQKKFFIFKIVKKQI